MSKTPKGSAQETISSRKEYLQQYSMLNMRIRQREQAVRELNQHLEKGTFPKRLNFLKSHPPMETPEGMAKVKDALQQVGQAILVEKVQDYERKLQEDRASLQTLKETRRKQRQQKLADKATQTPKKVSMSQLQQELRDLQAKYTELSEKLAPVKPKSKPKIKDIFTEQEPQES